MKPVVTHPFRTLTAVLMLVAFVWLALGSCYLVYVHSAHTSQLPAKHGHDADASTALPFEDDSQEKTENISNAFGIEFIYDNTTHVFDAGDHLKHYNSHFAGLFIPFIGDCVCQPPEIFSC